jgi:predicted acylesterase/phospholipase RssA
MISLSRLMFAFDTKRTLRSLPTMSASGGSGHCYVSRLGSKNRSIRSVGTGNFLALKSIRFGRRIEDAQIPLHIMATTQQGIGIRLSNGPAVDAILASTAIPGVFPAVNISGEALMDGAVAANTPVRLAADHHNCRPATPAP